MGLSEDMFGQVAISPYNELIAYEFLYSRKGASLKRIVEETVAAQKLPSEVFYERFGMVTPDDLAEVEQYVETKLGSFSVAINNTPSWPDKLKDSARPTPVLYYRGDIGLMEAPNISIVGARKASTDGKRRAALLAKQLVERNVVITTGLALGIDTAATRSAIEHGGKAIGVIGTPVDVHYPKENIQLQDAISREHLLVSQVPFYRYANQPFKTKRYYDIRCDGYRRGFGHERYSYAGKSMSSSGKAPVHHAFVRRERRGDLAEQVLVLRRSARSRRRKSNHEYLGYLTWGRDGRV